MLEAQAQFRRVIGHPHLAKLTVAVEPEVAAKHADDTRTTTLHMPITTAAPEVAAAPA